jgi:hypothetical protein
VLGEDEGIVSLKKLRMGRPAPAYPDCAQRDVWRTFYGVPTVCMRMAADEGAIALGGWWITAPVVSPGAVQAA